MMVANESPAFVENAFRRFCYVALFVLVIGTLSIVFGADQTETLQLFVLGIPFFIQWHAVRWYHENEELDFVTRTILCLPVCNPFILFIGWYEANTMLRWAGLITWIGALLWGLAMYIH